MKDDGDIGGATREPAPSLTSEAATDRSQTPRAPPQAGPSASIEVALATYNCERFIADLLDSLLAQTCSDFSLLVADDGSSDQTPHILEHHRTRYPDRIRVLGFGDNVGHLGNYSRLLAAASADYLMFCDHDDVWLPRKVELCLARMRLLEARHGRDVPLLVHTALVVTDSELKALGASVAKYQRVDPRRSRLPHLLLTNVAVGCSAMANRALYERARPLPEAATWHDHWTALTASALGRISFIDEPTILYRQHGNNQVGLLKWSVRSVARRANQTLLGTDQQRMLARYSRQAAALLDRFGPSMSKADREATQAVAQLWQPGRRRRLAATVKHRLRLHGLVRNIGLLALLMRKS